MFFSRTAAAVVLTVSLAVPASIAAFHQPPAASQEYVPVDPNAETEKLPAAPLVIGAYSVVWIALVLYVWSIWQRLARVEREIAQVSRRIETGGGR